MPLLVVGNLVQCLDRRGKVGEATSRSLGEPFRTESRDRQRRMWFLVRCKGGVDFVAAGPEVKESIESGVESVAFFRRWDIESCEHLFVEAAAEPDQDSSAGKLVESRDLGRNLPGRV